MAKDLILISLYLSEPDEILICNGCNKQIEREQTAWLEVDKMNWGTDSVYCEKCKNNRGLKEED